MKTYRETTLTLLTFFLFVVVFYVLGYWLIFRMGQATPLMLSVGMATIATCLVRKISLAGLGWSWGRSNTQWLSYLIPLAIAFVAYLIIWLAGFGDFYNEEFLLEQKQNYNLDEYVAWSFRRCNLKNSTIMVTCGVHVEMQQLCTKRGSRLTGK